MVEADVEGTSNAFGGADPGTCHLQDSCSKARLWTPSQPKPQFEVSMTTPSLSIFVAWEVHLAGGPKFAKIDHVVCGHLGP